MAIGVVVLALAVLCLLGTAPRLPPADSRPGSETPWPVNPESDVAAIPFARTNLLTALFASGWQPQFEAQNMPQPARLPPSVSPGQLPAGVYKTLPYTCIVVVPGPCPNDRAIISPSDSGGYRMPIIAAGRAVHPLGSGQYADRTQPGTAHFFDDGLRSTECPRASVSISEPGQPPVDPFGVFS